MTNEELDRLEKLADEATPGPWAHASDGAYDAIRDAGGRKLIDDDPYFRTIDLSVEEFRFIAAAHPGVVMGMIDEIRRLRHENDLLRMQLEDEVLK